MGFNCRFLGLFSVKEIDDRLYTGFMYFEFSVCGVCGVMGVLDTIISYSALKNTGSTFFFLLNLRIP